MCACVHVGVCVRVGGCVHNIYCNTQHTSVLMYLFFYL